MTMIMMIKDDFDHCDKNNNQDKHTIMIIIIMIYWRWCHIDYDKGDVYYVGDDIDDELTVMNLMIVMMIEIMIVINYIMTAIKIMMMIRMNIQ